MFETVGNCNMFRCFKLQPDTQILNNPEKSLSRSNDLAYFGTISFKASMEKDFFVQNYPGGHRHNTTRED
jgi:hypothetical protein